MTPDARYIVMCYGPGDWRVQREYRDLGSVTVAHCTCSDSAWAAWRLLTR